MTSAGFRSLQRGHFAPWPCDQQFVRFSDAVMVKKPPQLRRRATDAGDALAHRLANFRRAGAKGIEVLFLHSAPAWMLDENRR